MAEEDRASKTEPATAKKRGEARRKGNVAQSRDLNGIAVLIAAFAVALSSAAVGFADRIGAIAVGTWSGAWLRPGGMADYHALVLEVTRELAIGALPLVGALMLVGVLAPLIQTGPVFANEALTPNFKKMDPIKGLKKFASMEKLFDLGKSIIKLIVIMAVVWGVIQPHIGEILAMGTVPLPAVMQAQLDLGIQIAAAALAALAVLAFADMAWVRWRHEEQLKMSKQEVRDEMRQSEGSPELKSRVRSTQRELSQSRMLADVATADVVIRNPTHFAIALRYERAGMTAPCVVARGRNKVAERIIEQARVHEVPIVENKPVAQMLYRTMKVGQEIPAHLYEVVAEILAHVYRADRRRGRWQSDTAGAST